MLVVVDAVVVIVVVAWRVVTNTADYVTLIRAQSLWVRLYKASIIITVYAPLNNQVFLSTA